MNDAEFLKEKIHYAFSLLLSDDERHPVIADDNDKIDKISSLCLLIVAGTRNGAQMPLDELLAGAKPYAETIFVLGYRAGLEAAKYPVDKEVWEF